MQRISFALMLALAGMTTLGGTLGCNASLTIKPQTKFTGATPVTKTASRALAATDVIEIENGNGAVVVNGDASATTVSLSTTVFAFADNQTDADAALADLTGTIALEESSGKFYIHCNEAATSHGSAAQGTTGCEGFTITVPAGSATAPLTLKATAHNGSIDATGLTGSLTVHADNGDATASLTPAVASTIEVSSGNGDATLAVPAGFTADTVTLTPGTAGGKVIDADFPDVTAATSANRKSGGAKSITVSTDNGDVTLKKQ